MTLYRGEGGERRTHTVSVHTTSSTQLYTCLNNLTILTSILLRSDRYVMSIKSNISLLLAVKHKVAGMKVHHVHISQEHPCSSIVPLITHHTYPCCSEFIHGDISCARCARNSPCSCAHTSMHMKPQCYYSSPV